MAEQLKELDSTSVAAAQSRRASAQDEPRIDAFMLYNEKDEGIAVVVEALGQRNVSTHYFRRDVPLGADLEASEQERLASSTTVVIALGDHGWGPNQLRLASQASALDKTILPILIGTPKEQDLDQLDGLFRHSRYLDLRHPSSDLFDELVRAIRQAPPAHDDQIERILRAIVDGTEEQRSDALERIRTSETVNKVRLGARLRREIGGHFSPKAEQSFASAIRDPKRISSIRSWMLSFLVWSDFRRSEALLLRHVGEEAEPDRNVRFWTLAGLYQAQAPFCDRAAALAQKDGRREVSFLARALMPGDAAMLEEFRRCLSSDKFEVVWSVLRVLRIVPIPELASVVAKRLLDSASADPEVERDADGHPRKTPLSYDAFYALALPPMAMAAAPFLAESPGIEVVVERMLADLRGSAANAVRAFASVLAALDAEKVDRALEKAERDPVAGDSARTLIPILSLYRRSGENTELFRAGFSPETIDVEHDYLDVREDVQTLTAVMLSKDVTPPLAIGLFGDWGTGKSFFMKSMQAATALFEKKYADSDKFCRSVVPIEFNAWHYVDANLWASLVSHILERLDAFVTPQETAEEEQVRLEAQLGNAKAIVKQASDEKTRAEEVIQNRKAQLDQLQQERQKKEIKLSELRASDLATLLAGDEELKSHLEASLDGLGIPKVMKEVSDLSGVAAEAFSVRGRAVAFFTAVLNAKNRNVLIVLMLVVLVGIPGAVLLLKKRFGVEDLMLQVSGILAQLSALAAAGAAAVRGGLSTVKTNLERFEGARQKVDKLLDDKRKRASNEELRLEQEIQTLRAQESEVASRLAAASARVLELEERIKALREGRSLARFLAERARSEDYRKHLGLISTIRQDLDALTARLAVSANQGKKRVDRIILYIDDLDRCPADKVMDILQAVHLLLAYPLFVVVVGVDPRWLVGSLKSKYSAFRRDAEGGAGNAELWQTTPQNYLEKIFQITFSLRPMTQTGYAELVRSLFSRSHLEQPKGNLIAAGSALTPQRSTEGVDARRSPVGSDTRVAESLAANGGSSTLADTTGSSSADQNLVGANDGTTNSEDSEADDDRQKHGTIIHDESLVIRSWETRFAQHLYPLVPTPRAAKRFSNMYRLLKAPVNREQLADYEGTAEVLGSFQVPMLLLAILVGAPADAASLFPELLTSANARKNPTDDLKQLSSLQLQFSRPHFADHVRTVVERAGFPQGAPIYRNWVPRVARFSFEVNRVARSQRMSANDD